jgi:hypothetical protein
MDQQRVYSEEGLVDPPKYEPPQQAWQTGVYPQQYCMQPGGHPIYSDDQPRAYITGPQFNDSEYRCCCGTHVHVRVA